MAFSPSSTIKKSECFTVTDISLIAVQADMMLSHFEDEVKEVKASKNYVTFPIY